MRFLVFRLGFFLLFLFSFLGRFFFPFLLFSQIFLLVSSLLRRFLPVFDLVVDAVKVITVRRFYKIFGYVIQRVSS